MERIGYFFTRLLIELFRFVPFRVLYALSDAMAFVLRRVVGYRQAVIWGNLRRAFPEKSEDELRMIVRGAYRNLTDITLETIKGFTAPLAVVTSRAVIKNAELVNQYMDRGQSIILAGSHFNNWEWLGLAIPGPIRGACISAYKPLTNRLVDRYYNERRVRGGMIMASMEDTYKAIRKYQGQPALFLLIADQSPSSRKSAQWLPFFHQETAFMPGIEFFARRFRYPVLYFHVERVRRGYYELTYQVICADPAQTGEGEITRAYAEHIERIIAEHPESWLWSHKRWKIKRENDK